MIAHFDHDKEQEPHLLKEHIEEMLDSIKKYSLPTDIYFIAVVCALLHDVGKKSLAFQAYVRNPNGKRGSVKHAIGGAFAIKQQSNNLLPMAKELSRFAQLIIAGHHTGLLDFGRYLDDKYTNMPKELEGIEVLAGNEVTKVLGLFTRVSIEEFERILGLGEEGQIYYATLTRFAMSAMVDADWLSTEAYFSKELAEKRRYEAPAFNTFRDKMTEYCVNQFVGSIGELSEVKKALQKQAKKKGECEQSFYTLHAPTGAGKTIAGLEFALSHAIKHGKRRIIAALPLTNLTEEMSAIYKDIFGEEHVVENHSNALVDGEYDDSSIRIASENWDRPFIVTTTNQLMESLFHNKPMKVRKLHRLYGSVIILDEYHKLPLHVLRPILKQLDILQKHFDVTVLMMSATPFALAESKVIQSFKLINKPQEIANRDEIFEKVPKRVVYKWLKSKETIESLAGKIALESSVLAIMNTRKEAQQLYRALKETNHSFERIYHLSTTMCSDHRKRTLNAIKADLGKRPIAVVSTSVLEAGIDISFPTVYRMLAPLDAIAQAAGRCNRYGDLKKGIVILFELENSMRVELAYKQGIDMTRNFLQKEGVEGLDNVGLFIRYFKRAFSDDSNNLDKYEITNAKWLAFKTVAKEFKMIEDERFGVVCPSYEHIENGLLSEKRSRAWWRKIHPYTVSLGPFDKDKFIEKDGFRILIVPYDKELGVIL